MVTSARGFRTEELEFVEPPKQEQGSPGDGYDTEQLTFVDPTPPRRNTVVGNLGNAYAQGVTGITSALVNQVDTDLGRAMQEQSQEDFPTDPGVVEFVGQSLGSVTPTVLGMAASAPAWAVGGFYAMTGIGAGRRAIADYEERSGEKISPAVEVPVAIGYAAAELVPEKIGFSFLTDIIRNQPPAFLKKLGDMIVGDNPSEAAKMISTAAQAAAVEAPEEMTTELIQQGIQASMFDPEAPLVDWKGLLQAGAGGVVGGVGLSTLRPLLQNERVKAFADNPSRKNMQRAFGFSERTKEAREKIAQFVKDTLTPKQEELIRLEPLREREPADDTIESIPDDDAVPDNDVVVDDDIADEETQPEAVPEESAETEPEQDQADTPQPAPTTEAPEDVVRRQMGKQTLPDGREIDTRYEVRDIEELQDGEEIEGLETDVPLTDLNQRVQAGSQQVREVRERYDRGEGEQYIQELMDVADQYGLSPDDIKRHDKPILVKSNFSKFEGPKPKRFPSNLEPIEQAASDAEAIDNVIDRFNPTDAGGISNKGNRDFLMGFYEQLGGDRPVDLLDENSEPTDELIRRVENALFSKVYRDEDLIRDNHEGADVAVKNYMKAMAKAAPGFLKSKQEVAQTDILIDNVVAAYHAVKSAKRQKKSVADLFKDKDLKKVIPYKARSIAEYFEANNRKPGQMGAYLRNLANIIGSTEKLLRQIQAPDLDALKTELDRVEKTHEKRQFKRKSKPTPSKPSKPRSTGRKRPGVPEGDETSPRADEQGTEGEGRGTPGDAGKPETIIFDDTDVDQEIQDYYDKIEEFTGKFKGKPFQIKGAKNHGLITVTKSAKQQGKWQVTFFDNQGNPLSDMVRDTFDGAVLALVESADVDDLDKAEPKVLKGAKKQPPPPKDDPPGKTLDDYLETKSAMQAGKIKKTLSKQKRYRIQDGEIRTMSLAEFMEFAIDKGWEIVPEKTLKEKHKAYHYYYGPSEYIKEIQGFQNQEKARKAKAENDTKTLQGEFPYLYYLMTKDDSFLDNSFFDIGHVVKTGDGIEFDITKTEFDYAQFLKGETPKKGARKQPPPPKDDDFEENFSEAPPGDFQPGPTREDFSEAPDSPETNFEDTPQPERYTEGGKPLFELIDIVRLARELGVLPKIFEKIGKKYSKEGVFRSDGESAEIRIRATIAIGPMIDGPYRIKEADADQFIREKKREIMAATMIPESAIVVKKPKVRGTGFVNVMFFQRDEFYAAKVIAHELGHAFDWLPDKTLKRGNILGRIATLHNFMQEMLENRPGAKGPLTKKERDRLRREAEKLAKSDYEIDEEVERVLGVTAEDVLAIWNNAVDGKGGNEDLYEYIARLDSKKKVSIVKEALRGRVAEELKQFGRVVKEKTGKKIKVEGEGSKEEIAKLYRELIMKEVEARMLWENEKIREELKALTKWWNPFDDTRDQKYTSYRYSSRELYAEAISVLLNAPAELKKRAPDFYQAFFNFLDRKAEVHTLYNQVLDDIEAGMNINDTRKTIIKGFRDGDKAYWDSMKERRKVGQKISDIAGYLFADVFWGVKRRAWRVFRQGRYDDKGNPIYAIDNAIYGSAEQELYLGTIKETVAPLLQKHGLDWRHLDEYVLYSRVMKGDRQYLFNPEGLTPTTAKRAREDLQAEIGDIAFGALEQARKALWNARKQIIGKITGERMWTEELNEFVKDNQFYARFDVLKYIEKNFSAERGASIYRQLGTVASVTGPATATIMKDLSFIRAANWNKAKRTTVSFLQQHYPKEIAVAQEKWTGKGWEAKRPDNPKTHSLVTFMRDGQPQSYHIPKWAASGFDYHNAMLEDGALRAAQTAFNMIGTPFRLGFTALRPGFWMFNIVRDYLRAVKNLEGATIHGFMKYYGKALKPAFKSTFGIPDAVVKEMLAGNMLISIANIDGMTQEDTQLERMLAMYTGKPKEFKNDIMKPFMHTFHAFLRVGQSLERIPKIASVLYLDSKFPDMSKERKAHIIREQVGSPNFLNKGNFTPFTNNIFLFSNAILNAWKSDVDVIREQTTRARMKASKHSGVTKEIVALWENEAIFKTVKYAIVPKMIMSTLALGGIGALLRHWGYDEDDEEEWAAGLIKWSDQTKSLYDRITDYDKTNYLPIPITMLGNETMYLRVPQDEFQRFVGGMYWKATKGAVNGDLSAPSQALDFTSGQFPGLNPIFGLTLDTLTYLSGKNPYDSFRQRNVIPEQVFQAGEMESHTIFLKHLWNEAGGSFVYRFDTNDLNLEKNEWEKLMDAPFLNDIAGRFIKTTDYGLVEQQREAVKEPLLSERARRNERREDVIRKAIREGTGTLTEEEKQIFNIDDQYMSRKKKREERFAEHGTYERLLSNSSTVKERHATQLWILEKEGDDFDLFSLPSFKDDVRRQGDILRRAIPSRRSDRERWRDDIEEAIEWMNARNVTAKQVKEVMKDKINSLRSRQENWSRLNRQLRKITQE